MKEERAFFIALVLFLGAVFLLLSARKADNNPRRISTSGTAGVASVHVDGTAATDLAALYESWRQREQVRRTSPVRVLFVTDRNRNYDAGMSRHFFWVYDAMRENSRVSEAVLWGPGFAGFSPHDTLRGNIVRRFGSVRHFDMVLVYGAFDSNAVRSLSSETIVAVREHECWDDVCWPRVEGYNASLVFMTYAQDLGAFRNRSANRLFVNTPHGAKSEYFRADRFANRSTPVLVAGKVDPMVYPLRARFKAIVMNKTWLGGKVRAHPGYWVENTTAAALEGQTRDYAEQLKDAKVVMLDSSLWRYQFQKYAEVAMAGALIVGDLPYQDEGFWERIVVKVSLDDSDEHFIRVVNWWLEHEAERIEHVRMAQQLVLDHYTYAHTADLMLRSLDKRRNGQVGLWYPYPFSFGCLPVNLVKHKRKNAWCG